jgi:hypothetical protein
MMLGVLSVLLQFEVGEPVIGRVAVDVVDDISRHDRAVMVLPYIAMEKDRSTADPPAVVTPLNAIIGVPVKNLGVGVASSSCHADYPNPDR